VLVFRKFAELGSIRQVHLWLRHEAMELPAQTHELSQRRIVWKLPVYNSVYHILTNPVYAGAYVFGRSRSRTWLTDAPPAVQRPPANRGPRERHRFQGTGVSSRTSNKVSDTSRT